MVTRNQARRSAKPAVATIAGIRQGRVDSYLATGPALAQPRAAFQSLYRRHGKRLLDLTIVLLALPAWLPVILLLAFLVRLDGGPAFYSQERIGRGGRVFRMWKLRSMVVDADKALGLYLAQNDEARSEWDDKQKLRNDPRITRVGRFIRASSLDELPQLWNVLLGEMSLVGPRPMMTNQKHLYQGASYYKLRPGLTGPWQISARHSSSFVDRVIYDDIYFQRSSLLVDLKLIVKTFHTVVSARGV